MKRPYSYAAAGVAIAAFAAALVSARPASAQLGQPTPQSILEAIANLASITATRLSAIDAKLDALVEESGSDTLLTPPIDANNWSCNAFNRSDVPISVTIKLVSSNGSEINFSTNTINAGRTITVDAGTGSSIAAHCVFTVLNGSAADILASITSSTGASLAAR
jgi:hypothetical protein